MAELRELSPFAGLDLPLALGACRLTAHPPGPIAGIAPFPGQAPAVAARLGGFPRSGAVIDTQAGPLVWAGREMAFLFGTAPGSEGLGLDGLAAVTDQSDGWAGLRLEGADAAEVLARLVPLDPAAMAAPCSARSLLNHMPLLLIHPQPQIWDLWSFRSMAATMHHELAQAMRGVAARRELAGTAG